MEQCGVGGQIPLLTHTKPVLHSLNHLPGFIEFLWGSTRVQPLENGSETRVDAGNKPNQAKEGETHVLEKAFNLEEPEEALPAKPLLKTFNLQLQEGGVVWCGLGIVGIETKDLS